MCVVELNGPRPVLMIYFFLPGYLLGIKEPDTFTCMELLSHSFALGPKQLNQVGLQIQNNTCYLCSGNSFWGSFGKNKEIIWLE